MLEQYGDLKGSYGLSYEMDEARTTLLIQRLKRDKNVDAALKSARELATSAPSVLASIADLAPTERRAEILHEALKLRRDQNYSSRPQASLNWQSNYCPTTAMAPKPF